MDSLRVKVKTKLISTLLVFAVFHFSSSVNANPKYTVENVRSDLVSEFKYLHSEREKRDVPPLTSTKQPAASTTVTSTLPTVAKPVNITDESNRTTNSSKIQAPVPTASVTQTPPLLGENGTGIRHDPVASTPLVSDPIPPNDYTTKPPDVVKPQENPANLTYDNHNFYNSTFIGNVTYFNEYWNNITKTKSEMHIVLSYSHRKAVNQKLSFDFPFYGHPLRDVTVATGGFIYTGDHVHSWLAATQYIAPLMANFDTTLTNDSFVKYSDDGDKSVIFWENVPLQEEPTKKFTFAVVLYKNGNIDFVYKDIPMNITQINDDEHPVKVGISDAYLTDKILVSIRRKTIYEYHRISFKNHEISNNTILRLTALPTCVQYKSCKSCVNHETGFDCSWCEQLKICSSGTDRHKQDWTLRDCDRKAISEEAKCPAPAPTEHPDLSGNAYITDGRTAYHDTAVVNKPDNEPPAKPKTDAIGGPAPVVQHTAIGGVVAAFVIVALVTSLAAWILYAFKNPHTRSGQILIKYRPSQWGWRRGEARYTAATIHM